MASGDFVLQKYDGSTETLDTTDATTYAEPGSSIAPPGVYDGENVAVTLDPTASNPTATNVVVFPERVDGSVTNVAGSTVTLTNKRGADTVILSPNTKYDQKGATPTGVSDGEGVTVFGLPDPGTPGELDAQIVAIFSPPAPAQPPSRSLHRADRGHQPATAAVTQWAHGAAPATQPIAPRTPPTGGWSAPSGPSAPHGAAGRPRCCRSARSPGTAVLRRAGLRPPVTADIDEGPGSVPRRAGPGLVASAPVQPGTPDTSGR